MQRDNDQTTTKTTSNDSEEKGFTQTERIDASQFTTKSLDELRQSQRRLANLGTDGPIPGSEKVAEHLAKANEEPEFSIDMALKAASTRMTRTRRQLTPAPVEYDAARQVFFKLVSSYLSDKGDGSFQADGNLKQVLPELIKYFLGHESQYDQRKGIYLWGDVGRGKSLIMLTLRHMCDILRYQPMSFKVVSIKDLIFKAMTSSSVAHLDGYTSGTICFDDMGFEDAKYKLYGNTVSIMEYLLSARYNIYQQAGLITHITSNLPPEMIKEKYGPRIESRVYEMFNIIYLKGEDKRMT